MFELWPMKIIKQILWTHIGTPEARAILSRARSRACSVRSQVALIKQRWPSYQDDDEPTPVFLFSAGWRSGSTLAQRLLMSSGELFIWGEPFNSACIIEALARPLLIFEERRPAEYEIWNGRSNIMKLSGEWIANLHPPVHDLKGAIRSYLKRLFWEPVRSTNAQSWGIKDVRVDGDLCFFFKLVIS